MRQTFWLLSFKVVTWHLLMLFVGEERIGKRSQVLAIEGILGRREDCCRQTLLEVGGKAPLLLEVKIPLLLFDQQGLSREYDGV